MPDIGPRRFAGPAAFGAFVVVWFILFRPITLGGSASYEIVSGTSMEPGLHAGDLVIAQAAAAYSVGEVVVYRVPSGQASAGSLVVHRLVGGDADTGFVTQGDNRPSPDPWHPRWSDIVGRSWIELPGSGRLLLLLRTPLVAATILGSLAGFVIFTSGHGSSGTRSNAECPVAPGRQGRKSKVTGEVVQP